MARYVSNYNTNIPTSCGSTEKVEGKCILGVDEAGRGPVLGPLVYGACWCPANQKDDLKKLGFDDSKVLKEEVRDKFFKAISGGETKDVKLGWRVHVSQPEELSNKMLRLKKYDLNSISHDACMWLIQSVLDEGVDLSAVFIDTVGDPKKYQRKLEERFPSLIVTVAKKADSLYPIVSAASICAKVTRDQLLKNWRFREHNLTPSRKFGSGYPGDANTKKWLRQHIDPVFGFPSIMRFSWKTCDKLLEEQTVPVQFPELLDERQQAVLYKKRAKIWQERQHFFAENDMEFADF